MRIIIPDPSLRPKSKKQKIPKSPSQNFIAQITNKTLSIDEFVALCNQDEKLKDLAINASSLDFLTTLGMDLKIKERHICLASKSTSWMNQKFCFVDIEATDSNPLKGNLLEIGAILCNGKGEVFGRFESFVENKEVPPIIEQITGITTDDVMDAPPVKQVLQEFRDFIGTSILVAHNADFDYNFLDFLYWKHFGIGLYNQMLCTLKMAQKTLQAPRYSLSFLNDFLNIATPMSHRAYADAHTCKEIFLHCSKSFPSNNTQNILNWIHKGK